MLLFKASRKRFGVARCSWLAAQPPTLHNRAMSNLFRRLFEALVYSSEDDLRRQIQYLKAENEILRAKISGPVRLEPEERARLVKLGRPLGKAIKALISVAKPETFLRWVREADKVTPRKKGRGSRAARARPRTSGG
ncbi:MAG: hypothetical protein K2W85_00250 [Phycisphaerales bacterium]|nr:hypothetical protein [Phycisphaerales bacterium]